MGGRPSRAAGLLLLSDQDFQDFLRRGFGHVALSPTYAKPQKYHLVLRSSPRASIPLEADFTVSFD